MLHSALLCSSAVYCCATQLLLLLKHTCPLCCKVCCWPQQCCLLACPDLLQQCLVLKLVGVNGDACASSLCLYQLQLDKKCAGVVGVFHFLQACGTGVRMSSCWQHPCIEVPTSVGISHCCRSCVLLLGSRRYLICYHTSECGCTEDRSGAAVPQRLTTR